MTRKKPHKTPSFRIHKGSGQGFVEFSGRRIYLGRYDKPETREKYDRVVGEWLANGRRLPTPASDVLIVELATAFWEYAQGYYLLPDGKPTSSFREYKRLLRLLQKIYGGTRVADFGPRQYKAVRHAMIDMELCRGVVNQRCGLLKRVFRWGVSEGLVAVEVEGALRTVEGLRRGRNEIRESEPVRPVSDAMIDETLPHLTRIVRRMVQVQRLTGMRHGEVVLMRGCDLDTSAAVWTFRPEHHKTDYRARDRIVYIGPKAQAVLREFLRPNTREYLFSPIESEHETREAMHAARKTPQSCGNGPGTNRVDKPSRTAGPRYTSDSYRQAIERGCDKAFPAPDGLSADDLKAWRKAHRWSPNQLSHTFGTEIRREHGLEAVQLLLGHAKADITQIYAERDQQRAVAVALQAG